MTRVFMPLGRLFLLFLLCWPSGAAQAEERIAGTGVSITPPSGFEKADLLPGYRMKATESYVFAFDLPMPYPEAVRRMQAGTLLWWDAETLSWDKYEVGGEKGVMFFSRYHRLGKEWQEWELLFGDGESSAMVIGRTPKTSSGNIASIIEQSMLSAKRDKDAAPGLFEALPFRISERGAFRINRRMAQTLYMSERGVYPEDPAGEALVTVGRSLTEDMVITNRKQTARRALELTEGVENVHITAEGAVRADGMEGWKIEAAYTDPASLEDRYAFQVMLFDRHGFYIFQGLAPKAARDRYKATFVNILKSFRRVDPQREEG